MLHFYHHYKSVLLALFWEGFTWPALTYFTWNGQSKYSMGSFQSCVCDKPSQSPFRKRLFLFYQVGANAPHQLSPWAILINNPVYAAVILCINTPRSELLQPQALTAADLSTQPCVSYLC